MQEKAKKYKVTCWLQELNADNSIIFFPFNIDLELCGTTAEEVLRRAKAHLRELIEQQLPDTILIASVCVWKQFGKIWIPVTHIEKQKSIPSISNFKGIMVID